MYQDSTLVLIFQITAFIAAGFEHSAVNIYFIPIGLGIKQYAGETFWSNIGNLAAVYATLTWSNFILRNLLPITIGNIIGGVVGVGVV